MFQLRLQTKTGSRPQYSVL